MGTNFYGKLNGETVHIGKRSAAGLYCWDCGVTLCKEGVENVHHTKVKNATFDNTDHWTEWYKKCPKCGKSSTENFDDTTAARELGFNTATPHKKKGVATCSSFSWAIRPSSLSEVKKIEDEYGTKYTFLQFKKVLEECPIQYTRSIGEDFS